MRLSHLAPLAAALLSSACAGTRPIPVEAADRAGARIHDVRVIRSAEGWTLSGRLRGPWLETASRRGVEVEAFDADGARVVLQRISARRCARSAPKEGVDSARFEIELPASAARVHLLADPR